MPCRSWKLLHRRLHVGIERRRVAARLPEVAGGDQPAAELDDARIAHAHAELHVGRHARPAAARDEILIGVDRLLHRRHGLRRQDRRRRRDRPRDRRLRVEAFRPFDCCTPESASCANAAGARSSGRDRRDRQMLGAMSSEPKILFCGHRPCRAVEPLSLAASRLTAALSIAGRRHSSAICHSDGCRAPPQGMPPRRRLVRAIFVANRCRGRPARSEKARGACAARAFRKSRDRQGHQSR